MFGAGDGSARTPWSTGSLGGSDNRMPLPGLILRALWTGRRPGHTEFLGYAEPTPSPLGTRRLEKITFLGTYRSLLNRPASRGSRGEGSNVPTGAGRVRAFWARRRGHVSDPLGAWPWRVRRLGSRSDAKPLGAGPRRVCSGFAGVFRALREEKIDN